MERPDQTLVADFQHGDESAFTEIFARYKRPVLNFALRLLQNRADAEDVTGEVFMTLYTKKHAYQPQAKFSTWLFTVARNACISRMRKRKRTFSMWFMSRETGAVEEIEFPSDAQDSGEQLLEQERARMVRQCVQQLPQQQKEALILREYQGFRYDDIAQIMGCSVDNVKIWIYRARQNLRDKMAPYFQEDTP